MLLIFWTIFIILIVAIFVCSGKERRVQDISLKLGKQTAFVVFLSLVVLVYLFFDIRLERKAAYEDPSYALYFQDDNNFGKELEGFWTKGERRTSVILASDQPVEVIRVSLLGLTDGTATIQVGPSVKKISRNKKNGLRRKLSFPAPVGFRLGKDYLYTITIRDSSGFYPNGLDKSSNDNRYLGVFVKIAR